MQSTVRKKNIFVIGLDQTNLHAVKQVARAGDYRFHPLLSYDECYEPESVDFTGLLETSRETLRGFDGEVDALITHWDFPCTTLLSILAGELGLPAPSLEAMLRCEHKYWGRKVQHEVVPECTPSFAPVNPFDPPEITDFPLSFPFWIKPVKGFASQLGFYIGNGEAFEKALESLRRDTCVMERWPRMASSIVCGIQTARVFIAGSIPRPAIAGFGTVSRN